MPLPVTNADRARHAIGLIEQGQLKAAERLLKDVLKADAAQFDALLGLGVISGMRGHDGDAVKHLTRAVRRNPRSDAAQYNLGQALMRLGRHQEAAEALRAAVSIADLPHIHEKLGDCLRQVGRLDEAVSHYYRAAELAPDNSLALSSAVETARKLCDWSRIEALQARLMALAAAGKVIEPLLAMHVTDDPALLLKAARGYWNALVAPNVKPTPPAPSRPHRAGKRVRVGYLSADFRRHPMVSVIAEMIELHDRSKVEAIAYSCGENDGSPERRRMEAAFERFVDVRALGDDALVRRLRGDELDILVDLSGYTANARLAVVGARPAPIVCHYMGFPGTLGSPAYDYLIGDSVVVPDDALVHYAEAVVRLPHSYWAVDTRRAVAAQPATRREHGLPEDAVVLASFNGQQKLSPALLDCWARILAAAPDAVLWIYSDSDAAATNLRREAGARAIPAGRLVLAGRVPPEMHLARIALADLMLDTFPYGGHTTTCDALWRGVPVLSIAGRSFASRVGASLLGATNLDDMVVRDVTTYEHRAIELARDRDRLAAMKDRLIATRSTVPLFSTQRFARAMEDAFAGMIEQRAGSAQPTHFDVT
jgi:predicted O-linked N-acetylglucosamine transferase (SPINDLY family)